MRTCPTYCSAMLLCFMVDHKLLNVDNHYDSLIKYSGTSLLRSPTGLGKSDLNAEVTLITGGYLHCGIQFGTEPR